MRKSIFVALTMLSSSAMAADLDYYDGDDVPLAPTGPPAVVMVRPVPMVPVPAPVPAPIPVPVPVVPAPVPVPACGPEGVGSLQVVGNLHIWPPADALTVRAGPGVEFAPIGLLFEGSPVVVCGALYGWGKLQGGGWASLRYLIPVQ